MNLKLVLTFICPILIAQALFPNDTACSKSYAVTILKLDQAWNSHTGAGSNIKVCVVDSGTTPTHEDLKDNFAINEAEKNGKDGVDDDGNGCVDDIYGCSGDSRTGDVADPASHGTHCSGIAAATTNNGVGVCASNWGAKLIGCRFGNQVSHAATCINYCVARGAKVLTNSWGVAADLQTLENAVKKTIESGATFVSSAGNNAEDNDTTAHYPSNYNVDGKIAVAAIDSNFSLASFSNYGAKTVETLGAGKTIYSTAPPNRYALMSGTSMAAPQIASVASLGYALNKNLRPSDLVRLMKNTVQTPLKFQDKTVWGNAPDAVKMVQSVAGSSTLRLAEEIGGTDDTQLGEEEQLKIMDWNAFNEPFDLLPGETRTFRFAFGSNRLNRGGSRLERLFRLRQSDPILEESLLMILEKSGTSVSPLPGDIENNTDTIKGVMLNEVLSKHVPLPIGKYVRDPAFSAGSFLKVSFKENRFLGIRVADVSKLSLE